MRGELVHAHSEQAGKSAVAAVEEYGVDEVHLIVWAVGQRAHVIFWRRCVWIIGTESDVDALGARRHGVAHPIRDRRGDEREQHHLEQAVKLAGGPHLGDLVGDNVEKGAKETTCHADDKACGCRRVCAAGVDFSCFGFEREKSTRGDDVVRRLQDAEHEARAAGAQEAAPGQTRVPIR